MSYELTLDRVIVDVIELLIQLFRTPDVEIVESALPKRRMGVCSQLRGHFLFQDLEGCGKDSDFWF
jgi:hypothetical protein